MLVAHSVIRRRSVPYAFVVSLLVTGLAGAQTLSHGPDPMFHDGFQPVTSGPTNDSDAARFLAQATFGPTDADIATIRSLGYQGWLNQQFAAPVTLEMTYLDWIQNTLGEDIGQNNRQEAWFLGALGGPDPQNNLTIHNDQLRQRVAFALSEILVISDQNASLSGFPTGMAYYYDILANDAFGNYRTLLQDVTLSPAMGVYLNMMGNQRANSSENVHPDENYAREINQLFSIGLVMLNIDGTPQLSNGQTIPTYVQATVSSFAHVFTGWNWSDCDADGYDNFQYCGPDYGGSGNPPFGANYLTPMVAFDQTNPVVIAGNSPSYHDNGTNLPDDISNKQLLSYPGAVDGGVLANGGTAASDLAFAIDNIYGHPNVGPFISKQLIIRLVTSNPSPAYVQRVATVFNNNRGSRTQMQSVVQAILLDPEARTGQWKSPNTFGKLREPLLALTHFWRAMKATHVCGQNVAASGNSAATNYGNQPYRYAGYSTAWSTDGTQYDGVDQASLDALTVFNFFKPNYMPPGEMTSLNLMGPEFQISTDSIIANTTNTFSYYAYYFDVSDDCSNNEPFGDVKIDHTQDVSLAGSGNGGTSDPATALVAEYNKRFMSGQMSPFMQNQLLTYLNSVNSTVVYPPGSSDWRLWRIYPALYLIFTSPEYMIQK